MLRKKLVEERRENAQKKKSADQGSEPDNRITQNALPEETPIVASPPVYQDIYSRVPMLPMLPLPVFYNEGPEGSGGAAMSQEAVEFEGDVGKQGFYGYPQPVVVEEGSGVVDSEERGLENAEEYELPSEEESSNLLESEEEGQAYTDEGSGSAEIYEDSKSIEQPFVEGTNEEGSGDSIISNRDDTAAASAETPQARDDQAGGEAAAQPAAGQPTAGQPTAGKPTAGQPTAGQPAAGQPAGQKPETPAKQEGNKGNGRNLFMILGKK